MDRINVTRSFLPPLEEYMSQVKRAYDNSWLTNRGELVLELEDKLTEHLELSESQILLMNNGTVPLQIALKLLGNRGEVITTPFSYVATTSSIVWEECTPVFVDVDPETLTIDETLIEGAITEKTTCILATHVFGNPCNVEEIERIAKKHSLKVIYDGAHAFGVKFKGKSIFEYGDVSTCSFHATKLFHTGEGGAVFCKDPELYERLFYSHNFGHNGPLEFHGLGINGKMSELNAAMGLSVLPYMSEIIQKRSLAFDNYIENLHGKFNSFTLRENTEWNYSYFPVIFESESALIAAEQMLKEKNIFPRRYFYPSLNKLPFVQYNTMHHSEKISNQILCLPLFHDIDHRTIEVVCKTIIKNG